MLPNNANESGSGVVNDGGGSVSGSINGPMGGSISGPIVGPISGPVGGPIGGSIGGPPGSTTGETTGGPVGATGSPGGTTDPGGTTLGTTGRTTGEATTDPGGITGPTVTAPGTAGEPAGRTPGTAGGPPADSVNGEMLYPAGEDPKPAVVGDVACSIGCARSNAASNRSAVKMFVSDGGSIDDPLSAGIAVSNSSSDGPFWRVGCIGCSEMRLPQRARMKFLPSHSTVSPALMVTGFAVQKILSETR